MPLASPNLLHIKESLFALYLLEVGYVLGNLKDANILAFLILNREIPDIYLASLKVNPEFGYISLASF